MAFTTTMTTTASIDDSIKLEFDQRFLIAVGQTDVTDQLVQYRQEIGAKSIQLTKYPRMSLATTPLTEDADGTSEEMTDTQILVVPAEYGNVVTYTTLADLQSGGQIARAAVERVGLNVSDTVNKLACLALDAGTAVVTGGKALASVLATDVMDLTFLNKMYNKLARNNVGTINGLYVAMMHDDVINDLRTGTGTGSWQDVTKYATPETALRNEVGMFGGFRIIRNNAATFADQSGAGLVDIYNSYFLGDNALGKVESAPVGLFITGPFDKYGRFLNVGWKGCFKYQIIDTDAAYVGQTASSVGNNAA